MGRSALWIGLGTLLAAGCTPTLQREQTTFAVLAGVYYSGVPGVAVEAAMVEEAETLLKKAVADLNAAKDLDFVLVAGDLLARSDPLSLDRAKSLLAELHVPYYVVLGDYDGPGPPVEAKEPPPNAEAAVPVPGAGMSRGTVIWAFQGHGFAGSEGYWVCPVPPDLVLVATPVDLARLLKLNKPSLRVTYELEERTRPGLAEVLGEFSVRCRENAVA